MKTATIADVTQEEFDEAVQTVISGIKASDPKLDTRLGTVLRSLLVNPEARIEATTSKQIEYVRKSTSLKTMQESEAAGEEVDVEDVNAVMSNFNVKSAVGTYAEGLVKMTVMDGTQAYTVSEGAEFSTVDGLVFRSVSSVTAVARGSTLGVSANSTLWEGAAGYFLLVPVRAVKVGAAYNLPQGTSLSVNVSLYTFVAAEAYKSFNGGSDVSDLQETIDKIPAGLSIRGFVNKSACEGMLRDKFDDGPYPIVACSTVGYGNAAQRRDKHNAFGVGVGGRIDLYVRNFGDLYTVTATVTGRKVEVQVEGSQTRVDYVMDAGPDQFPGAYWVKDVGCTDVLVEPDAEETQVNSPLEFSCTRKDAGASGTWHDFDVSRDPSEVFDTIWQGLEVTAMEVPPDGDGEWPEERTFLVTAYCLPQARELQAYVDGDDVRSVSTDVVVRCPIVCNVTVSATVVYDTANPMDEEEARYRIRKYINGLGFVKSLTRSEIVHILKSCGAVSVDLSKKDMLYGTLYDAYGKEYNLSGDSLQLDGLAEDGAMLSSDTAVFAAEPENIQITLIPNE